LLLKGFQLEIPKKKFGLSRNERIKSKKDFEKIFSAGETLLSSDRKIRVIYIIDHAHEMPGVKIAPAVSRKNGTAVWRNRIKRLLRESFRLNKEELVRTCSDKKILLKVVFSFTLTSKEMKTVKLRDIMPSVEDVLKKLLKRL
jgi:ribonuclease P protein component